jgi:hypothetical protein
MSVEESKTNGQDEGAKRVHARAPAVDATRAITDLSLRAPFEEAETRRVAAAAPAAGSRE